jgi:hypothetical protein
MTPRLTALSWLAAALAACSSVPVTTHAGGEPPPKLCAVVLEPVAVGGSGDVAALGDRLTLVTLSAVEGQALVWAGNEVQVLHPGRTDWTASGAVPLLRAAGVRPEDAVLLRARVEIARASSQQEVRGAGSAAVGAAEELRYRATVEVFHPSTGRLLVDSTAEARADPFSRGSGEDPGTELARVLGRAAAEALGQLAGRWSPPREPSGPPLDTWIVLGATEDRLFRGLDAEVERLGRLQVANPGLDETEAARLARLPAGVLVRQAVPGARLREGELVLTIDRAPARAAALARARFGASRVALEVRMPDGHIRRMNFP